MSKKEIKMQEKKIDPKEVDQSMVSFFSAILVRILKDLEKKYGKKIIATAKDSFLKFMMEQNIKWSKSIKSRDLETFIDFLLGACNVGHEYRIIKRSPTEAKLEFTNCPYANAFREIGAAEIGEWFCLVDDPAAKLFNKDIKFKITKKLMLGDSVCNHHYTYKKD
jgi:hypothetical protein